MKLIEANVTNNEQKAYVVNGVVNDPLSFPDGYAVTGVTVNGEDVNNFGTTWSGVEITQDMCFSILAAAFVNDDTTVDVQYACDALKSFKDSVQSYTYTVACSQGKERRIPNVVVTPNGEITNLCAVTRDFFYRSLSCFYVGGETCLVTREDGTVATDIEEIMTSAMIDCAEKDEIIFLHDSTRYGLAEEYDIDVDVEDDERKYLSANDIIARTVFDAVRDMNGVDRKIGLLSNNIGTMGVCCNVNILGDHIERWGTYTPDKGDEVYVMFGNGFVDVVKGTTTVPSYQHCYEDPNVLNVSEAAHLPVQYDDLSSVLDGANRVANTVLSYLF